jgi:hypothetical protein
LLPLFARQLILLRRVVQAVSEPDVRAATAKFGMESRGSRLNRRSTHPDHSACDRSKRHPPGLRNRAGRRQRFGWGFLPLAQLRSRSCIIDGEAVCCGDDGVPSFDRIRYRRTTPTCSSDLRREPFEVRKATLASVVAKAAAGLRPNEHIQADGRVRPRLQDGSGGHRIEAQGAALHERPLGRPTDSRARNEELVAFVIRIVCLGLLGYLSLILIRPFLTIIIWSIIITVALYPILEWLRQNFMAIAHWRRLQLLFSPFS